MSMCTIIAKVKGGIVYYVSQIRHMVKMLTLSPASEKSS